MVGKQYLALSIACDSLLLFYYVKLHHWDPSSVALLPSRLVLPTVTPGGNPSHRQEEIQVIPLSPAWAMVVAPLVPKGLGKG
jgi:hypothetical protein